MKAIFFGYQPERLIYGLVGTEEQKEASNSLPAQVERLERYCRRIGFDVMKVLTRINSLHSMLSIL